MYGEDNGDNSIIASINPYGTITTNIPNNSSFKPAMYKIKKKLKKFKARLSRNTLDEIYETDHNDIDHNDEVHIDDGQHQHRNDHLPTTQLEAKQRLLLILASYCYSTDPLAPHRNLRPAISEYAQSIMTRSGEVESPQKWDIVRAHLQRENVPTMLVSSRCWSQNDINDLRRDACGARKTNIPTGGTVKGRVLRRIQTLVASDRSKSRQHLSASESNLNGVGRIMGAGAAGQTVGASRFYCSNGVYKRSMVLRATVADEVTVRQAFMRRWRAWTSKMRRPRRVGDADNTLGAGP